MSLSWPDRSRRAGRLIRCRQQPKTDMLIPQNQAADWIGTVNPGFGYWWVLTGHGMLLYVPDSGSSITAMAWRAVPYGLVVGAVLVGYLECWRCLVRMKKYRMQTNGIHCNGMQCNTIRTTDSQLYTCDVPRGTSIGGMR